MLAGDIPASRSGGAFGALLSLPGRLAELSEVLDGYRVRFDDFAFNLTLCPISQEA